MSVLDENLGALEIGIVFSIFLFGIFTVQVFIYSQSSTNDPRWLKYLVLVVGVLETAHMVCSCILLYNITVTHFGNLSTIAEAPFSLDFAALLSAWIGAIIQAFYAFRVKGISGRLVIPIISWCLSFLRACFGILIGITAFTSKTLTHYIATWHWLVITEFSLCAVIDVLNTTSICFYLLRKRSQIHSNKLVDRIILFSIETGLLTSITALAMLASALTMPNNLIYIGILMPYAKLFSNSFMASLNARRGLRHITGNTQKSETPQTMNSESTRRHNFTEIYFQAPPASERMGAVTLELSRIDSKSSKLNSSQLHLSRASDSLDDAESAKL